MTIRVSLFYSFVVNNIAGTHIQRSGQCMDYKYHTFSWLVGWLVGCFGLNGPLKEYFSLYRASPREREKEERKDRGE